MKKLIRIILTLAFSTVLVVALFAALSLFLDRTDESADGGTEETAENITDDAADDAADDTWDDITEGLSDDQALADGSDESEGLLTSADDLDLHDTDGYGTNYEFIYDGEYFSALYTGISWQITDSYRIRNTDDITIICQALSDIHPIWGSDYESYRTAEDMAYEWGQHNLAYDILPSGSTWKESAKDVDLDPEDQGRSLKEMYEARTGRELNIGEILR